MQINYDEKHIYRINSSMRIKKVMWHSDVRRDNLTDQRADLVHSIYKLLWSFSEVCHQSIFCIIVLHDCVLQQPASSSECNDRIYCVTSARSKAKLIYIMYENYYIQWLLLYS